MSNYYKTDQITLTNLSQDSIEAKYSQGYVFTRLGKGVMNQTRSLRINLKNFNLTSENRRILKHNVDLTLVEGQIPMTFDEYDWEISKLAKEFYETKFGSKTFTTNKARELLTNPFKSNYNALFTYKIGDKEVGYVITLQTEKMLHYAYPFYQIDMINSNLGMGMMLKAILYSKDKGHEYFYLGSATKPEDKYKLQFKGLEWSNGRIWSDNIEELKELIQTNIALEDQKS
jgi:arginyl-tRNA--protein-N-Asp/Glu arginylyltransferase